MAGLSAAATIDPDAGNTLPNARVFVNNAKNADGGHQLPRQRKSRLEPRP
jgi:hypothetical protein